jgi:predicted aconitase
MFLTNEEESILYGSEGPGAQKAMELLVALGRIYGADRLIPITSAHLSGVSYKTIGEGGISFLEEMSSNSRVKVPTTLNPAGMDLRRWREMGVDERFAEKQRYIIDLYSRMGVDTTCTCTPYLQGNLPGFGEHVAWAESSALSFVNSIVGARTNREGGPGALAAAIIGKTAEYGLHLDENRRATVVIEAEVGSSTFDMSLLGQTVGALVGNAVPYFRGIRPEVEGQKMLAAAMAASGAVAMFHIEGMTPEAEGQVLEGLEVIHVSNRDLEEARLKLTTSDSPQLIALGCPHLTEEEIRELARFLKDKCKRSEVEIWFCTSREIKARLPEEVAVLERFGMVLEDTCMVVAPIEGMYTATATNSAKACNYLPTLCSQKVHCDSAVKLLEAVL